MLRRVAVVLAAVLSVVFIMPMKSVRAEEWSGFTMTDTSNYSFSAVSRARVQVFKTLEKSVYSSGHYVTMKEDVLIGETECIMRIGTSKVLFGGETHKIAMIRQIMNPKRSYSSRYSKYIYGVNRSTQLYFNYVNPYYEMDFFPEALSPTGTQSESVTTGISIGASGDSVQVVGSISTGLQKSYNMCALTISTTKNGSIRKMTYSFSSNDASTASGFQNQVNDYCKSSYKAYYSVAYSRSGSPTQMDAGKRIVNYSTYWCQKLTGVTGTGGSVTASASFNNAMY